MEILQKAGHWIKEHPLAILGILGGLVVVYLLVNMSSGSGGGTTVVQSGPSDAAVQAGAAVQAAQIQAQGQVNQLNAELAAVNSNNAANIAIATLQAQVQQYTATKSADVSLSGIDAQKQVQIAGLTTQQIIAAQQNATNVAMAQLSASVDIAKAQSIASIYNAPYQAMSDFYNAAASGGVDNQGRNGLVQLIYGAEGTKGSTLILPGGIMAGRVGSAGGSLFGNQFGDSSAGGLFSQVLGAMGGMSLASGSKGGYGFQTGGNVYGTSQPSIGTNFASALISFI